MGYISNSDIETRLGSAVYVQLTDDTGAGTPNEAVVNEARAGAEGELDAYLARRYAVPIVLSRHPELTGILSSMALDLAEYRLRLRRPPISSEAVARRDAAVVWLQRVASGEIELPAASAPAASTLGGFAGRATGAERVMTREDLSGF